MRDRLHPFQFDRMVQIIAQLVIQFIFMYVRQSSSVGLPQWVYRVDSCPDPSNFSQWIDASRRLNCYHKLDSADPKEQAMVYHCLPSSFLNETVEFCGTSLPISPGYCPIYNYQQKQISNYPTYYNCTKFTLGCPTKMFHSKNVYTQPDCLKINRITKCYVAETDCPNIITHSSSKTTTEIEPTRGTTIISISSDDYSENMDSVNVEKMSDSKDSIEIGIAIAVLLPVLVVVTLIIVLVLLRKRIFIFHKYLFSKTPRFITDDQVNDLEEKQRTHTTGNVMKNGCPVIVSMENDRESQTLLSNECDQHCLQEKENDGIQTTIFNEHVTDCPQKITNGQVGCQENEEELHVPLLGNMLKGATIGQYNKLLWSLAENMTTDVFNRIKCFVKDRDENESNTLDDIHKPKDLLDYLDKTYFVFNNIVYLQGLFLACKAPDLYDRCLKYAESRGEKMFYFEARILESDHTKVKYVIKCPGISAYPRSEVDNLRLMLATLIQANYDDILVTGLQNGCVIVTMMIRNCLIPTLKALYTSEKISMTCHWMLKLSLKYKIIKVMIRDEIIYPPDILSNAAELTAEENISRHVLQSSFKCKPEIPKAYYNEKKISKALEFKEKSENCKDSVLSKDMTMPKNSQPELTEFTNFLEGIGGRITDDTKNSMKILLHDYVDKECVGKMNPTKLLTELSNMLKLQYNVGLLEWMFDKCGEAKLVNECQEFSAKNQLECFETNFTPCSKSQPLEIQFMVFELKSYRNELHDLRYWLAKTIHVHPGQILMTALKNRPIVVTLLMREKHGNAILEYLKTDDGRIAASRKRIEKIVLNGNVIEIGKALNGSNFVQIRLRFRGKNFGGFDGVRNVALNILRRTGIRMEGNEIYTTTVPTDPKREENTSNSKKEETFIEKNRNVILENFELTFVEQTDFANLFGKDDLADLHKIGGRKDRAEYFLTLCDRLPKEKREIACAHLERCIPMSKEKSSQEKCPPPATVKNWIENNREKILDEIDYDFFKSTIDHMEDVPEVVKISWSDTSKSRKEKATIFLEFALQKEEYVRALKKTLEEYGIQLNE